MASSADRPHTPFSRWYPIFQSHSFVSSLPLLLSLFVATLIGTLHFALHVFRQNDISGDQDQNLRNWELQGSNDGFQTWTTLFEHIEDHVLQGSSAGIWKVESATYFQSFRLFMTKPLGFNIKFVEFFGDIIFEDFSINSLSLCKDFEIDDPNRARLVAEACEHGLVEQQCTGCTLSYKAGGFRSHECRPLAIATRGRTPSAARTDAPHSHTRTAGSTSTPLDLSGDQDDDGA